MTVLAQILIVFGILSLFCSVLVLSAMVLSSRLNDVGRVPVVDTDSTNTGSEREAENAYA
jgi:hypothetical protein